jgi:hypothetical protein
MTASQKHMTRFGLLLGVQALLMGAGAAAAASLDQDACARLKTELLQLELAGTRNNMGKGPDWAKGNLSADKLLQIKRLLDVEEQLLFRCQGKPLVVLPEGVEAEPPAPTDRAKEGAVPTKAGEVKGAKEPQPPGKAQAKQPASKGPVAKAPSAPAAGAEKAPPAPGPVAGQPKPKPKAKPKVDDAYRPPQATSPVSSGAAKP